MTGTVVPSFVGGIPNQLDLVPSILVVIGYATAICMRIKRQYDPNTRIQWLCTATIMFAIERMVVYSLRAGLAHTHTPGSTISSGLIVYPQLSYAMGWQALTQDINHLVRITIVNASVEDPSRGSEDRPGLRKKAHKWTGWYYLILNIPVTLTTVAYGMYHDDIQTALRMAKPIYIVR